MDRSTIYFLQQEGWSNIDIAEFVGQHRSTIAQLLREPVDKQPAPRHRVTAVAAFAAQIPTWRDQKWTVQRMLELARSDPDTQLRCPEGRVVPDCARLPARSFPASYQPRCTHDSTRRYMIVRIRRYVCPSELAPVLEAALAANGYAIEIPYQENSEGDGTVAMAQGSAFVLLSQEATRNQCEIDIWGEAQHLAAVLLESLPLNLVKLPTLQVEN